VKNFAMTGVAGFVAPRHLDAIYKTGNRLVAAVDPHDAVGVLDRYSREVRFFTEVERFDRHLEKLRRGPAEERVHFLSICSPNYLHDAHIRIALRVGADVVCEKPVVINPWNLDALELLEQETGGRVNVVLQLRLHPVLQQLRVQLDADRSHRHQVDLTYVTPRGPWYQVSWKGSEERSGGLVTNIGIHFFDVLIWLFGGVRECQVTERAPTRSAGTISLERADVKWLLSSDWADLSGPGRDPGIGSFRQIVLDGNDVDFTSGITDLHTRVYEEVMAGRGFRLADARPSIELVHRIRQTSTL
jgi:UDP-N-acetyl-2-amino-2-deoxyglucuronate dehydrogenase